MVHEPSFFTLAAQAVRRLRSRSVAVMESLSPAASKRKFDRIGMVVLRSTTPWVAVNSFSRSCLLTVISIIVLISVVEPVLVEAMAEGIALLPNCCFLYQIKKLINQ